MFALAIRLGDLVAPETLYPAFTGTITRFYVGVYDSFVAGPVSADDWGPTPLPGPLGLLVWSGLLLFATVRRRNGWAGLHELVTATRVVMPLPGVVRPVVARPADVVPPQATVDRLGPYQVLEPGDHLVLGYDGRLRRRVWIRRSQPDTPGLPAVRRDLSRPGRLHWLTGRREAKTCWDAYEAVEGQPFVSVVRVPQPWSTVRHWLRDLATELATG